MAEDPADLEISLDRLIGRLAKPGASKEAKAILVDARRLRTLVGNWRTIQPTAEAQREMALRVEQLLRSADALLPPEEAFVSTPPAPRPSAPRAPAPVESATLLSGSPLESATEISPAPLQAPTVNNTARLRSAAIVEEIRPGAISDPFMRRSLSRDRMPADALPSDARTGARSPLDAPPDRGPSERA
ncbi:MAG: hypothetical protein U0441_02725, partial [Polyangiaceae bacterium]